MLVKEAMEFLLLLQSLENETQKKMKINKAMSFNTGSVKKVMEILSPSHSKFNDEMVSVILYTQ